MVVSNPSSASSNRKRDNSLGMGVYYADADYVGALRRIGVLVIDGVIILALSIVTGTIILAIDLDALYFAMTCAAIVVWLYCAVLKPSRFRTVGYQVMGCQIVRLNGQKPSPIRMTFREMLWLVGPFSLLYDLAWCGIDEEKQTLCDRFSGTTMVSYGAKPIGTAPIHLSCYTAMTYGLFYPRVIRPGGLRSEA